MYFIYICTPIEDDDDGDNNNNNNNIEIKL